MRAVPSHAGAVDQFPGSSRSVVDQLCSIGVLPPRRKQRHSHARPKRMAIIAVPLGGKKGQAPHHLHHLVGGCLSTDQDATTQRKAADCSHGSQLPDRAQSRQRISQPARPAHPDQKPPPGAKICSTDPVLSSALVRWLWSRGSGPARHVRTHAGRDTGGIDRSSSVVAQCYRVKMSQWQMVCRGPYGADVILTGAHACPRGSLLCEGATR